MSRRCALTGGAEPQGRPLTRLLAITSFIAVLVLGASCGGSTASSNNASGTPDETSASPTSPEEMTLPNDDDCPRPSTSRVSELTDLSLYLVRYRNDGIWPGGAHAEECAFAHDDPGGHGRSVDTAILDFASADTATDWLYRYGPANRATPSGRIEAALTEDLVVEPPPGVNSIPTAYSTVVRGSCGTRVIQVAYGAFEPIDSEAPLQWLGELSEDLC